MKKTVTLSTYVDLEGHIDEIISNLRNLQDEYENKYINLRIDSAYVYDDSKTFQLVGDREETEEEMQDTATNNVNSYGTDII